VTFYLGKIINDEVIIAKLVRAMYFVETKEESKKSLRASITSIGKKHKMNSHHIKARFYNRWFDFDKYS
tara:strand:+ start:408 stop:614 length:207 start_codon:yes stop_codon:yes gene_type:complete